MNERVLILRDAVVKITQMLSGKGIRVTQRGITACVKADPDGRPVEVNLPFLPDNATEELCLAIQGFLDHEVAHILFSDFKLSGEASKSSMHPMLNMLEDARIEKAMAARFTGSGHNLAITGKFFLDKYITPAMEQAAASGDANKVVAVLMPPLIRALSGQFIFSEFMKDKMHIVKDVYDKIADLQPKIEAAASTQDCLNLAKEITKRLRDENPPGESGDENDSGSGGGKGEGGPSSGGSPKKSDDPGKGKSKPKPKKGEGEGEEDDKSPDAGGPGEENPGDPEEGENPGSAPGDEEGEDEDENAPSGSAPGDEEDPGDEEGDGDTGADAPPDPGEMETGNASAVWEEIDKESKNGFDAAVSNLISNAAADAASSAPYLIYTKEGDTIEPLHVGSGYNSRMLTDLSDSVDHMVGPLQKDLERAIAARSYATWESGRRSGRLHAANLSRLAVKDARVFRKRHETTSKDVAVELVIDASGSMGGSKIHLATRAAYALSQVLERLNITHEVIAFTTGSPVADMATLEREQRKMGRNFTRIESLNMPIIKGFNERLKTEVKERFGWLPNCNILRNNIDGECVETAARRLMSRREAGKIMIVLSDGAPNAQGDVYALYDHLKKVIRDVTAKGTKVVGIGIQTSEVQKFYPKNIVINDVDELPDRVIKELRHLLLS